MQIMYSNVVEGVKRLTSLKNPQVQPHAVLQWLTREFDVEMPQVFTQQGSHATSANTFMHSFVKVCKNPHYVLSKCALTNCAPPAGFMC